MATVPWLRMTAINPNELFDGVGSNFAKGVGAASVPESSSGR